MCNKTIKKDSIIIFKNLIKLKNQISRYRYFCSCFCSLFYSHYALHSSGSHLYLPRYRGSTTHCTRDILRLSHQPGDRYLEIEIGGEAFNNKFWIIGNLLST